MKMVFLLTMIFGASMIRVYSQDGEGGSSLAVSTQDLHIGISVDLFGPISSFIFPQYRRVSPQLEIALPGKSGLSVILDGAYRRTESKFDTVFYGTEPGKASIFVETKSILAGVRKYFAPRQSGWPLGPYAELTAGYEHQYLDTSYNFLTDDPVEGNDRSENRFTVMGTVGYQGFFTKRFLFSAALSADMRRIVEKDAGWRIFIVELNFGYML